jgi:hypothetical protein
MRKLGIIAVLSLMALALAAVPALAQNPHFVGSLVGRDAGTQLRVSGKIAGLGQRARERRGGGRGHSRGSVPEPRRQHSPLARTPRWTYRDSRAP